MPWSRSLRNICTSPLYWWNRTAGMPRIAISRPRARNWVSCWYYWRICWRYGYSDSGIPSKVPQLWINSLRINYSGDRKGKGSNEQDPWKGPRAYSWKDHIRKASLNILLQCVAGLYALPSLKRRPAGEWILGAGRKELWLVDQHS